MSFLGPEREEREKAAQIADLIAPIIAAEMADIREREKALRESIELDEERMMAACRNVGEALDELKQSRYTRLEIKARARLERAAETLRTVAREREDSARRRRGLKPRN